MDQQVLSNEENLKPQTDSVKKMIQEEKPFNHAHKSENMKESLPDKTFEQKFRALIANLQTKEQSQSQCQLQITLFIEEWNLNEAKIYQSFQASKYPEEVLEPSLFEKFVVFELKKMVENNNLDKTRLKSCLDAIDDVLSILDKLLPSFPLKAPEEECLYYYLMTNFLFLIRENSCRHKIYSIRSYFRLKMNTKYKCMEIQDVTQDPIICDVTEKLKQIFQNLLSNKIDFDMYYQDGRFIFFKENIQIEGCRKISYEIFTALLGLIPKKCVIFSGINITSFYGLNLYNNMIGLHGELLERNGEPESVIKARCLLVLLSEVARVWQIETLYDGHYFQPIMKDAIQKEGKGSKEEDETGGGQDNKICNGNNNKTDDDEEFKKDETMIKKESKEVEWKIPKTNEDIYFLERALYGGEINLKKIKVHQAEMILDEKNYCSLKLLNNLKDKLAYAVENVWNVKGLRIGRADKDPRRKCGHYRK